VSELAETLDSGRILMRICPIWLPGWVGLCKKAVYGWLDDHAATMGAAIASYMVFSLAPMLVMVVGVAGLAFGREAAEGALFGELVDLIGSGKRGSRASSVAERERHAIRDRSDGDRHRHIYNRRHCSIRAVAVGSKRNLEGSGEWEPRRVVSPKVAPS
jgi:hypothetical protein